MWMKYIEGMARGITGSPEVGDRVLFKAKRKSRKYQGIVSRVLSPRKYMIKYEVPLEARSHFIDGTSTAIADIKNMMFFNDTVPCENEEMDKE